MRNSSVINGWCYLFDWRLQHHCSPPSPRSGKQRAKRKTFCRADGLNSPTTCSSKKTKTTKKNMNKMNVHQTHCSCCWGTSPCFCQEELSFPRKQPSEGGGGGGGAALCSTNLQVLEPQQTFKGKQMQKSVQTFCHDVNTSTHSTKCSSALWFPPLFLCPIVISVHRTINSFSF